MGDDEIEKKREGLEEKARKVATEKVEKLIDDFGILSKLEKLFMLAYLDGYGEGLKEIGLPIEEGLLKKEE